MWKTLTFKSKASFDNWIQNNSYATQWHEVFINNGYAVEFRVLKQF